MLSQEEQDYLKAIWTDPSHPGSFAGPHKLYKIVRKEGKFNIGLKRIRQFLSDQDAYSLQKRVQRKFPRNRVINFLKNQGVHLIFTQNETKSNYAERSIQNIKNRLYRMFTETKSYENLSKLKNLIKSINDIPSRPLKGMAPSEVNDRNENEVRLNQYLVRTKTKLQGNITKQPKSEKKPEKKRNRPYKVNDLVRITHLKRPFMREYDQKWTGEVFKVSKRFKREGIPVYYLNDMDNDPLKGGRYPTTRGVALNLEKWKKLEERYWDNVKNSMTLIKELLSEELEENEQDYLRNIWTDPKNPGAYAGPNKLYEIVRKEGKHKIGLRRIRQFLSDQDAYSLQKRGVDSQWDGDLMDVKNLSKWNKGVQYILVAQDVFSRYVFAEPMDQRKGVDTVKALEKMFLTGRKPNMLRTDKGSEFKNKWVSEFLKNQGIHLIFTQNETKSNYAERSIQNLKNRMYRMFSERQSYEYINELSDIVKSINNTPSLPLKGMTPSEVNRSNESE
ncbi:hypothetical protein KUTeg_001325, partial [Tegillarca granosa]